MKMVDSKICSRCGATEEDQRYLELCEKYDTGPFICKVCHGKDIDEEHEREFAHGRWMETTMKGSEVWTHHTDLEDVIGVDGRVCVGIVDTLKIMYNGKEYTISQEQADDLWKDIIYGEYGTNDEEAIARIEGLDKL